MSERHSRFHCHFYAEPQQAGRQGADPEVLGIMGSGITQYSMVV